MTNKKVALSASFWQTPQVADLLKSCDVVFTTNERASWELEELLGAEKLIFLGNATPQNLANARKLFPEGTEFVTYSELHCLHRAFTE